MRCLEKFNEKMKRSGNSLRNENIQNSQEFLTSVFEDDASLSLGIYLWELGLNSYNQRKTLEIRLYERSFSNANGVTVKFQTLINTKINVGDIIYDSIADEYLICTESFNINGIHWQGKFTLCNWILRWQNKNGVILEYPCYDINSTQYNSGEQSNKQFTIGSSQHMITLPCDENTVVLSSPQRFILDKNKENPTVFIVTQNDTTSYSYGKKGLVKITLFEHVLNPETDRIDLGICDYVDFKDNKKDNSTPVSIDKSIISYDTTIIKSGGDSQIFVGKFYDAYGVQIKDIVPKWDVICDFRNQLTIEKNDNHIKIGIDNDNYIDEEFKLVLSDINDNYRSELIIRVESLL